MSSTSGSKTAAGSITLTKKSPEHPFTRISLSGTYGTVVVIVEGSANETAADGSAGSYQALAYTDMKTGATTTGGNLALVDNTTYHLMVPSLGLNAVRLRVVSIVSGTITIALFSTANGEYPFAVGGGGTISGDLTVNAITSGDSVLAITGVAGSSGSAGGSVPITGGVGDTNGAGGATSLTGGAGAGSGLGGAASITGGLGGTTNAVGGAATVTAGAGRGTGNGAIAGLVGGASGSGATGTGGVARVVGGAAASTNGSGGAAQVTGGVATGTGTGGAVTITSGASAGAGGTAGNVVIDTGAAAGGTGGSVLIGGTNAVSTKIGTGAELAGIKAINVSGTIAVAVPSITDPDIAKVDVDLSGMTFAPAVGDMVIAIPLEDLPANARLQGAWINATDQVQITFGSEGGNVTGGNKNFKFLIIDLT